MEEGESKGRGAQRVKEREIEKELKSKRERYSSCERGDRKVTVQTSQLSLPLRLPYADSFFPNEFTKRQKKSAAKMARSR